VAKDSTPKPTARKAPSGDSTGPVVPVPAQVTVRPPRGVLPPERAGTKHGWHSQDAVQIPTSLRCSVCPLYHVKRKDKRHALACREGRKNRICPILTKLQQDWACGLIREVEQATGTPPVPSDNARIEQIVRHRSRIFQIENYLKVAGLIDLKTGEARNVADRLVTTENALSRVLSEFRQSLAERRVNLPGDGPRLEEYLREIQADKTKQLPPPKGDPE
jgi:hypothetical protein